MAQPGTMAAVDRDALLASLLSLGFEMEPSTAAVQAGFQSMDAAVDWYGVDTGWLRLPQTTRIDDGAGGFARRPGAVPRILAGQPPIPEVMPQPSSAPQLVLSVTRRAASDQVATPGSGAREPMAMSPASSPAAEPAPSSAVPAVSSGGGAAGPVHSRFHVFEGRDELIDRVEEKKRQDALAKARERRLLELQVPPDSNVG